jgi:Uma2 family endonuclease
MQLTRTHHRFTVDDYEQMIEYGILTENDRVELIRGEIVTKKPIGDSHVACVNRLNRLFGRRVGESAIVSIQNPIRLPDSEPEPDLALLRPRQDFYASGKPRPEDIFLVIEVADTTLDYDREDKRSLYAEAGIPEYWIVNLIDRCLEVYRQPLRDSHFADVISPYTEEEISLIAMPGISIAVAEIL